MVRLFLSIAVAALTILAALSLDARLAGVRADDRADCNKGSVDTRLRACSRIIKSGRLFGKPLSKKTLAIVYYNRGNAYRKKGQYDRAIADYDTAIKLNPKFADAYITRGNAYYDKGQYDRAIANYDTAIKLNPKLTVVYGNRGLTYEKLGQLSGGGSSVQRDKAIADFRKAIELRPGDETATSGLKRLGVTP